MSISVIGASITNQRYWHIFSFAKSLERFRNILKRSFLFFHLLIHSTKKKRKRKITDFKIPIAFSILKVNRVNLIRIRISHLREYCCFACSLDSFKSTRNLFYFCRSTTFLFWLMVIRTNVGSLRQHELLICSVKHPYNKYGNIRYTYFCAFPFHMFKWLAWIQQEVQTNQRTGKSLNALVPRQNVKGVGKFS